jgi:O-antigen/teichoic acid export membrane protein
MPHIGLPVNHARAQYDRTAHDQRPVMARALSIRRRVISRLSFGGAGSYVGLRLAQYAMLFLAALLVSRSLGPADRGEYALPLSLAVVMQLVLGLSLEQSTGRLLARREASAADVAHVLWAGVIVLGSIGALLTVAIGLPFRASLMSGASAGGVVAAAALVPVGIAHTYGSGLVLRLGGVRAYGLISLASASTHLLGAAGLIAAGVLTPETGLLWVVVSTAVAAAGSAAWIVKRVGRTAANPWIERGLIARVLRPGLPLHLSAIALFLNLKIDLFLVSVQLSRRETGLYSLAVTLTEFVFFAAWTLGQVAVPAQTLAEEEEAADASWRYFRHSVAFAAVLAAMAAAAAYPVVRFLYGAEWVDSVPAVAILAAAAVGISIEPPLRAFLARILGPRRLLIPATAALVTNVLLNLLLIPVIGITGAALSSLVSYWLFGLMTLTLFARATERGIVASLRGPGSDEPGPSLTWADTPGLRE